ncbi:protein of unknown function [Paraburkholderia kururiensis]
MSRCGGRVFGFVAADRAGFFVPFVFPALAGLADVELMDGPEWKSRAILPHGRGAAAWV